MYSKLFVALLFLFSGFGSVIAQQVQVFLNVPGQITAGIQARVELNIRKGSLEGFARFQQLLPPGVSVRPVNSANADFSFAENRLNLIWLALPPQEEIVVSYDLVADRRITGSFDLGGKFSYLLNNERSELDVATRSVSILPAPDLDPALAVNIADFAKLSDAGIQEPQRTPAQDALTGVYRQRPYLTEGRDRYLVTVVISRGRLNRFARLEEQVLSGHVAKVVDSHNAIFSFEDGMAKFLWMNLPQEPVFTVSYELVAPAGRSLERPVIKGALAYVQDGEPGTEPVSERDFTIPGRDQASLAGLVNSLAIPVPEGISTPKVYESTRPDAGQPARSSTDPSPATKGIVFSVQVGAFRNPVDRNEYFRQVRLTIPVSEEYHQGLYKYTVGTYTLYREATAQRDQIIRTTGLTEAFVCAFQDGKRISVQQALRLTGQKWEK